MAYWKNIQKGWGSFSRHTRLVVGDGNMDVWVGDTTLKDVYPTIFRTAWEQEAYVAELSEISTGSQL